MQIKSICKVVIMISLASAHSLSLARGVHRPMNLSPSDNSITGWISTKGEWMLFNQKDFKSYSPYGKSENYKCVSLINGTGKNRSYFSDFGDKEVIVKGRVAEYDKLSSGTSAADKFLSKKYFGGEVVENYCLRDFVFIVESMELKGNSRPD